MPSEEVFPGRVLIASPPPTAIGGVANHTRLLVQNLAGMRLFDQWLPLRERSARSEVRALVHAVGIVRWVGELAFRRPDVVHLQVTSPGLPRDALYARIARLFGTPVLAHLHTSGFLDDPGTLERLRRVAARCEAVVVMSETVRRDVEKALGDSVGQVHVIANPAPPMPEPAAPGPRGNAAVSLLCVGQVSREKGQLPLARAVERLRGEGLDVALVIVGPSILSEDDTKALHACEGTSVVGPLRGPELTAAYDAAGLFVLFSRTEAEPLSLLEAMSRGLPVVATRTGSVAELVNAPRSGNVVVDVDDEESLAREVRALCADPTALRGIGAANREWVRTHRTVRAHVLAISALYRRISHRHESGEPPQVTVDGSLGTHGPHPGDHVG